MFIDSKELLAEPWEDEDERAIRARELQSPARYLSVAVCMCMC